ncbi:MAG TPA: hypothetical protein VL053_16255 [Arachidicoccus sp.]|nr:hypothetical protein [Arachidicoccus sp.]
MMKKTEIIIDGSAIIDIPSFYDEINRVLMQREDWKLAQSLDGFNDLLYGGFGILNSLEDVDLIWKDIAASRAALGYETTKAYYLQKLVPGTPFDKKLFRNKLEALEAGAGQTYFDIILEIIAAHPNIRLKEY